MSVGRTMTKRVVLVTAFLISSIGVTFSNVPRVQAGTWLKYNHADCQGDWSGYYPSGDVWIQWTGYSSSDWGFTSAGLWHYNGSTQQWELWGGGSWRTAGASGTAGSFEWTNWKYGTWDQTATHQASFFIGNVYSDSGTFWCST
jgi:hypothetical protein